MKAILLASQLWFVSYQAMDRQKDLAAALPVPVDGGAFATKAECVAAGATGVNHLTIHRPASIKWVPGLKWKFKCRLADVRLKSPEELARIHSGHQTIDHADH